MTSQRSILNFFTRGTNGNNDRSDSVDHDNFVQQGDDLFIETAAAERDKISHMRSRSECGIIYRPNDENEAPDSATSATAD